MKPIILLAAAIAVMARSASALPIITFSEAPPVTNMFDITDNGNGTSSLLATNVPITISAIDGPLGGGVPFSATFSLTGLSTDAAQIVTGIFIEQFSGTYSINSATCGASTVCLAGNYIDDMSGINGGHALSMSASTPPGADVTMTSDPAAVPISDLGLDRAIAFAMTNVLPPVGEDCTAVECTLVSSTSIISGNASAGLGVPEPFSLAIMGIGLMGLGLVRRQRNLVR